MRGDIRNIGIVVYVALSVLFSVYFVVLNSDQLILYTFPLFILLAVLISHRRGLYGYFMWTSIAMIASGVFLYTNVMANILPYYTVGGMAVLGAYLWLHKGENREEAYALGIGIALPVLSYAAGLNLNSLFGINISIIGFYLLISVVVSAMFSSIGSGSLGRLFRQAATMIEHRHGYVAAAAAVLGLMLLFLPIWPAGLTIKSQNIAYVPVSLSKTTDPGYLILYLNASRYADYINNNVTNIGFAYPNGSFVTAYIPKNMSFYDNSVPIVVHANSSDTGLEMYLMPIYSNYNGSVEQVNYSGMQELHPKPISADFGNVVGGDLASTTLPYTTYVNNSYISRQNIVVSPYYFTDPICEQGRNTTASVEYAANSSISAFLIDNGTLSDNLIVTGSPSDPVTYDFLMSKLSGVASGMHIATGSGSFDNISIGNDCAYLAIVAPRKTALSISVDYNYSKLTYNTRNVMNYRSSPIVVRYTFLPGSMSTLVSKYRGYIGSG